MKYTVSTGDGMFLDEVWAESQVKAEQIATRLYGDFGKLEVKVRTDG